MCVSYFSALPKYIRMGVAMNMEGADAKKSGDTYEYEWKEDEEENLDSLD